jgi:hypothetical protein
MHCKACEWMKGWLNLDAKSSPEQTLTMPAGGLLECSFLQLAWTAEWLNF